MQTAETLSLLKAALSKGNSDAALAKAFTQSSTAFAGLTAYSLEAPAKTLYPVITPLRNTLPRVTARGSGIQANWRAITRINKNRVGAGVGEGQRGGVIDTDVKEYLAAFRAIGLDDNVTFEAEMAAEGFDDVKARAVEGLLRSLMIAEEGILLGGNGSYALGTTPTPTVATAATGGAIAGSTAVSVRCVALTPDGFGRANMIDGVVGTYTITRGDGSSFTANGGAAAASTAASVTTGASGSAHLVTASVAAVRGAAGYAWFAGAAGSEKLVAITAINSVVITALPASDAPAVPASLSADRSVDSLVFDGLMTIAANPTNGSYFKAMPTGTVGAGTGLTADGAGGIVEFDEALKWFWDNHRLSPTNIWVSSQEMNWIRKKILGGSSGSVQRFVFNAQQSNVMGGITVRGYSNPFSMGGNKELPIELHPNLPPGTVLFTSSSLPYTLSGVQDVMRVLCRRDYYQIEWPLRTRRYEYGVYSDEVLQHYAPFSMGMISNIAAA